MYLAQLELAYIRGDNATLHIQRETKTKKTQNTHKGTQKLRKQSAHGNTENGGQNGGWDL